VPGTIDTENWKDMVEEFTGYRPPDPDEGQKEKKTSGVSSHWLRARFEWCEDDADEQTVERYARVWLWHLIASFLLPDASGNTVSWMVIPQLREPWENIAQYSWGSATLAWLYRQLCEACRRASPQANIGGCTYLLQLWIWERIPSGRVHREAADVSISEPFANCSLQSSWTLQFVCDLFAAMDVARLSTPRMLPLEQSEDKVGAGSATTTLCAIL
jgi:hypothetical protein